MRGCDSGGRGTSASHPGGSALVLSGVIAGPFGGAITVWKRMPSLRWIERAPSDQGSTLCSRRQDFEAFVTRKNCRLGAGNEVSRGVRTTPSSAIRGGSLYRSSIAWSFFCRQPSTNASPLILWQETGRTEPTGSFTAFLGQARRINTSGPITLFSVPVLATLTDR